MTRASMLIVLACMALWHVSADNSSNNTSDNATNGTSDDSAGSRPPLEVKVDVQGQSGAFTVYDKTKGKESGIVIKMDALKEVDLDGNPVGTSGSVKHSINSFATQSFTIESPENVTIGNASANKISFSSPIKDVGQIGVDTYVMSTNGSVGTPTETWTVKPGDIKWNINLSSWAWCGNDTSCKKGQTVEVGHFIDLEVTVKGKQEAKTSDAAKNKNFDLGGGLSLQLSDQVQLDGSWVGMPSGYPKVSIQGSSTVLTFRFPKFNASALYDPMISGFEAAAADSPNSPTNSNNASNVDACASVSPSSLTALLLLVLAVGPSFP